MYIIGFRNPVPELPARWRSGQRSERRRLSCNGRCVGNFTFFDFGARPKVAVYDGADGTCATGGELRAVSGRLSGDRDCV